LELGTTSTLLRAENTNLILSIVILECFTLPPCHHLIDFSGMKKIVALLFLLIGGFGAWPVHGQVPPAFDWVAACGLPSLTSLTTSSVSGGQIALDAAGNSYVAGYFTGTARFGVTVLKSVSLSEPDVFVAKLDAEGNYLWAQSAGGSGYEWPNAIAVDSQGNAYITGYFGSSVATFGGLSLSNASEAGDAFVAKLEGRTGTWQWAVRVGGNGAESGSAIAVDRAGQVVVSGVFESRAVDFGPMISLTNARVRVSDVFVAKLTAATGAWQWAVRAGGTGREDVGGLAIDAVGDVYVTGSFSSLAAPFGPTILTATTTSPGHGNGHGNGNGRKHGSFPNVYVAKLNAAGTGWLWAVQGGQSDDAGGGSVARALALDSVGNVYVAGDFSSATTRFGTAVLVNTGRPNTEGSYSSDVFVAKLSGRGSWLWAQQAGGAANENAAAVTVGAAGRVAVIGAFSGAVPPISGAPNSGYYSPTATFGATVLTSAGGSDFFVAQLDAAGNYDWVTQGGGDGGEWATGLARNATGMLYCTGTFTSSSVGLDPWSIAGAGTNTGFLARLAASPLAVPAASQGGDLAVWPNPAREAVWVAGATPGQVVAVIDGLGRLVAQAHPLTTDPLRLVLPTSLPKGLYLVRHGQQARRLLVE
jgi:hypothetical protein